MELSSQKEPSRLQRQQAFILTIITMSIQRSLTRSGSLIFGRKLAKVSNISSSALPWTTSRLDTANTPGEYYNSRHGQVFIHLLIYDPSCTNKPYSPGRFFAANELKAMMAHIVLNYDVKFENEGVRPPNVGISLTVVPDPTATVLFRKRRDWLFDSQTGRPPPVVSRLLKVYCIKIKDLVILYNAGVRGKSNSSLRVNKFA